ncbi:MAG: tRNA (adenosine(37)-N6)-threonylcarbamoyltransferase complex ATPase subunit type 1 TsaE [Candidatus Staskawiczbacteria bacterium]|nr:tRNA (adenosine(37)-N6)-threonylcarbamoyltransferase complex ATPase subunit type 1 TsaE [Candidatus Staskawiczbacteria bacterium]
MSTEKIITNSSEETQKFSEELAGKILRDKKQKKAVVLTLSGDLGAGKTTFIQGFAKGLGIEEKILSPTFIVMKRFKIQDSRFKNFYHFDCYRLDNEKDLETLGFVEIIENPENIVAIEWPEGVEKILPKEVASIKFEHLEGSKRELIIE